MSLRQTVRIGSEQSMKPSADGQRQQRCVQEALGNVPAATAEIVDSVLGLELAEQQLDLPTGGSGSGVSRRSRSARRAGELSRGGHVIRPDRWEHGCERLV